MVEKNTLTQKQKRLLFLIPGLDDCLVDRMIAIAMAKEKKWPDKTSAVQNSPYVELMSMIGCHNAKTQLTAMIADYRMRKIAEMHGRNHVRAHYHAVFSGNPGCAKTTCARLYAQALANEGVTKTSRFAELSRSSIVGEYMGSTAPNVREIFRKNAGGVIFIDEAYSLTDSNFGEKKDYGEEAINEIIVSMENHPETVVIFAGYPKKMESFLESNPGLASRIPYKVMFEDYTTEELIAISKVIADNQGYIVTDSAIDKLYSIFENARTEKDFGNGRYVRNLIDAAIRTKGTLLGVMNNQNLSNFMNPALYTDDMLFSLDESCFDILYAQQNTTHKQQHKIGF